MHYSMIVAAENYDELTRRLAPFQRNDTGKCPREHMVFFDAEPEYRSNWPATTMRRVRRGDDLLPLWDDQLAGWNIYGDQVEQGDLSLPVVDVPVAEIYGSVEAWLEADGHTRDPEAGKYGYWDNPNGHWIDWTVGGRWSGLLDGYDPTTNPVNFTPCDVCGGSGDRPGWVSYAATVPAPDGSLNVFRGPKREQVVLAAAEYIAVPVNPVQMFDNAVRRRPRRLVADPFDPEVVLQRASVTVARCFTDVLAEWSNGCDGCKGSGRIHAPFNAPHPGDSMIARDVDWSAIKDRQAAEAAQRWDGFIGKGHGRGKGDEHADWQWQALPSPCYHAICGWLRLAGRMETIKPESFIFAPINHEAKNFGSGLPENRHVAARRVGQLMDKIAKRAGLEKLHPHMLRHTFAHHLYAATNDLKLVQHLLGHENSATTDLYIGELKRERDTHSVKLMAQLGLQF
jgi:hypothetical protein